MDLPDSGPVGLMWIITRKTRSFPDRVFLYLYVVKVKKNKSWSIFPSPDGKNGIGYQKNLKKIKKKLKKNFNYLKMGIC